MSEIRGTCVALAGRAKWCRLSIGMVFSSGGEEASQITLATVPAKLHTKAKP